MKAIVAGVGFFALMGLWYLSHSWMEDPEQRKIRQAGLLVAGIISALLIFGGLIDVLTG